LPPQSKRPLKDLAREIRDDVFDLLVGNSYDVCLDDLLPETDADMRSIVCHHPVPSLCFVHRLGAPGCAISRSMRRRAVRRRKPFRPRRKGTTGRDINVNHPIAVAFHTIDVAPAVQECLDLSDAAALGSKIQSSTVMVQPFANASGKVIGGFLLMCRNDRQRAETCGDIGEHGAQLS
jgi:hypothetical protein